MKYSSIQSRFSVTKIFVAGIQVYSIPQNWKSLRTIEYFQLDSIQLYEKHISPKYTH